MGMKREVAAPGVQDAKHADLPTQETWVPGEELSGGSRSLEEQIIEQGLMAAGCLSKGAGQGESEQEIRRRQEQVLLSLKPLLGLVVLAFWTMAIAAGVVAVAHLAALRTGVELPAEGLGPAGLNGAHGPAVRGEQSVGELLSVGRAVAAEYICQF